VQYPASGGRDAFAPLMDLDSKAGRLPMSQGVVSALGRKRTLAIAWTNVR